MSIFGAEVIGTAILILLGNGVVAGVLLGRSKAFAGGWIVITFGWAMAVALAVYTVAQFSGAHINPAVTLGSAVIGNIDWDKVPEYIGGQFVGAFIGATLVWLAYFAHWGETEDQDAKLSCFCTIPAIRNPVANVTTEVIGTFLLVFVVLALGFGDNDVNAQSGIAALLVGLLVFAIGLSLGGPTGYAINPARDLGPRIMHAILPIPGKGSSDWGYALIPVIAPIIGGILGAVCFDWWFPDPPPPGP